MKDGPADRYSHWLRVQIWLAVAGIGVWIAGAAADIPFVAGVGTGIMVIALATRFLRGRPPEPESGGDGA